MQRRVFLSMAGSAAVAPLAARLRPAFAQTPRMPRLGVLVTGTPDPTPFLDAFRGGLRSLGYSEERNLALLIRSADGQMDRLPALAAELAAAQVDILVTFHTPPSRAAKQTTSRIPIVMAAAGDPVGTGLVASLRHPGGNVTGLSTATAEVAGKMVQLIREMMPQARRLGALCNVSDPFSKPFFELIGAAGAVIGIEVRQLAARGIQGVDAAFAELRRAPVDVLIVQPSIATAAVAERALTLGLPATSPDQPFPSLGGLLAYCANAAEIFREAAWFVDRILKGTAPAELPVQQPTTFDLVVNLRTARALGVTVPQSILVSATEVIE